MYNIRQEDQFYNYLSCESGVEDLQACVRAIEIKIRRFRFNVKVKIKKLRLRFNRLSIMTKIKRLGSKLSEIKDED